MNLKSVKRRLGGVLLCLVQANEDNELLEMLQMLVEAIRLVVMETGGDLAYQEDSDGWGKNLIAFVKE